MKIIISLIFYILSSANISSIKLNNKNKSRYHGHSITGNSKYILIIDGYGVSENELVNESRSLDLRYNDLLDVFNEKIIEQSNKNIINSQSIISTPIAYSNKGKDIN